MLTGLFSCGEDLASLQEHNLFPNFLISIQGLAKKVGRLPFRVSMIFCRLLVPKALCSTISKSIARSIYLALARGTFFHENVLKMGFGFRRI
jgi:hypothetical protein